MTQVFFIVLHKIQYIIVEHLLKILIDLKRMKFSFRAFLLTFIQYTTLPFMLWEMTWFCSNIVLLTLELLGLFIASWAIWEMQKSKLNIAPTPRKNAFLVDTGIYKWIRHPMYTSLLLVFVPMLAENINFLNISVFTVFIINLIFKLHHEEKLLLVFFEEYSEYKKKTWKMIPYIY